LILLPLNPLKGDLLRDLLPSESIEWTLF
jgi:hypothetical protein